MRITSAEELETVLKGVDIVKRRFNRWAYRDISPGFKLADYRVLVLVTEDPEQLQDISARRGITQQATGKIMQRLTAFGFVKVKIEKDDKRAKSITISKKGITAKAKAVKIIDEILKRGDL